MSDKPEILKRVEAEGFVVFGKKYNYDLNIIGLRNPHPFAGRFDDLLFVVYAVDGKWQIKKYNCTTDPSLYWLRNPTRVLGTAIMVSPQQCRSVYKLDHHNGKYLALCQRNGSVKVWRDSTRDQILDREGDQHEGHGINIHRASAYKVVDKIGRYSAGCTVIQNPDDFDDFIDLCKSQIKETGFDTFSYTLLDGNVSDFEE